MKSTHLLSCLILLTPALAPAAATVVNFAGTISSSGPGSMAAAGGLATSFNTVSGFGLAPMSGGNRQVMSFSGLAAANANGLSFTHGSATPNVTGYTILMDIYYPVIPNFVSLAQLDLAGDGDIFGRASGGAGISGDYAGTTLTAGAWHRFAATVDNSLATGFLNLYVDGLPINSVNPFNAGRFDLSDPTFLLFADEDGETADGYISQFYFNDRPLTEAEISALGEAKAGAIPEPSGLLCMLGSLVGLGARRRRA